MNAVGWIGAAVCAGGLVGMGMLIENCRVEFKKNRIKYKHVYKPKPVPQERKEWGVVTPSEMFERACKNVVDKTPEKFE